MREAGNGSIINISSISGIVAGHNFAAYNSAKAAVRHLSKSVALHCARSTELVRCNSVHPVFAQTEMMKSFFENPNEELVSKKKKEAFQLLCYCLMYDKNNEKQISLNAGIISFKNMNLGLVSLKKSNSVSFTNDELSTFKETLDKIIEEIFDTNLSFSENESLK